MLSLQLLDHRLIRTDFLNLHLQHLLLLTLALQHLQHHLQLLSANIHLHLGHHDLLLALLALHMGLLAHLADFLYQLQLLLLCAVHRVIILFSDC